MPNGEMNLEQVGHLNDAQQVAEHVASIGSSVARSIGHRAGIIVIVVNEIDDGRYIGMHAVAIRDEIKLLTEALTALKARPNYNDFKVEITGTVDAPKVHSVKEK